MIATEVGLGEVTSTFNFQFPTHSVTPSSLPPWSSSLWSSSRVRLRPGSRGRVAMTVGNAPNRLFAIVLFGLKGVNNYSILRCSALLCLGHRHGVPPTSEILYKGTKKAGHTQVFKQFVFCEFVTVIVRLSVCSFFVHSRSFVLPSYIRKEEQTHMHIGVLARGRRSK